MEKIYYLIGFYISYSVGIIILVLIAAFTYAFLINKISSFLKVSKLLIEFAWKRKEFQEWLDNYEYEKEEKRILRKRISDLEADLENIYKQQ